MAEGRERPAARPAVRCVNRRLASETVGVGGVVTVLHVALAALPPALSRARGRVGNERQRSTGKHERSDEDFRGLCKHGHLLRVAMPRRPAPARDYFRARCVCIFSAITMAWRFCDIPFANAPARRYRLSVATEIICWNPYVLAAGSVGSRPLA